MAKACLIAKSTDCARIKTVFGSQKKKKKKKKNGKEKD